MYVCKLFKGKELSVVFGLLLSMARGGSIINYYSMLPLYNWVASDQKTRQQVLGISLMYGKLHFFLQFLVSEVSYVEAGMD